MQRGVDDVRFLSGGCVVQPGHGLGVAVQQRLYGLRVFGGELLVHDQDGGGELAGFAGQGTVPQVLFIHQDLRSGGQHQTGRPRLRQPRAVELSILEQLQGLRIVRGVDGDVAAAVHVGFISLRGQPGTQCHVLGAAKLRGSQGLSSQVRGGADFRFDHQLRPARGGTGDDADGLPRGS